MAVTQDVDLNSTPERVRSRSYMLLYSAFLGMCGLYYGLGLGTFNSYAETWCRKSIKDVTPEQIAEISQKISLYFFVGCTFAGFSGSWLAGTFGRHRLAWVNCIFAIVLTLAMLQKTVRGLYLLRFLQGVSAYLWTTISPLFIREILPLSGMNLARPLFNISIASGIFVGYIFKLDFFKRNMPLVLLFPLISEVPKLVLFLTAFRMESPAWLVSKKGSESELIENYRHLYNSPQAEEMAREKIRENASGKGSATASYGDLLTPEYRMQTMIVLILSLLNQLTGMNIITVFSTSILTNSGLVKETAEFVTTAVGFVGLLATIFLIWAYKGIGMRNLLTWGLLGQAASLSVFLGGLAFNNTIAISVGMCAGMFAYNASLGGVLFSYNADLVPANTLSTFAMIQWIVACVMVMYIDRITALLSLEGLFFCAQLSATLGGLFYVAYGVDTAGMNDPQIKKAFMEKKPFQ